MDVLSAVVACSLFLDDQLVRAVIQVNSQGNPLFVGDTISLVSYDSVKTPDQARHVLEVISEKKGRAVVGLMGVPPEWGAALDYSTEQLWDACINVSVATAKLSAFSYDCAHPSGRSPRRAPARPRPERFSPTTRACVLKRYGQAVGIPTFAAAVLKAIEQDSSSDGTPAGEAEAADASPIFPDAAGEASRHDLDWSNTRLFFPSSESAPTGPPSSPLRPSAPKR
jgi:hypothetical protein